MRKRKTYPKKSYKKKAPKSTTKLIKLIKSVNIRQSESKYKTTSYTWGALSHDDVFHKDLWNSSINLFPGQGTSDTNRVGDRIVCQGNYVKGSF